MEEEPQAMPEDIGQEEGFDTIVEDPRAMPEGIEEPQAMPEGIGPPPPLDIPPYYCSPVDLLP